jgi:hypothetical protein
MTNHDHDNDVDPLDLLKAVEMWWLELDRFRRMQNDGGWHPGLMDDLSLCRRRLGVLLGKLLQARRNG